MTLVLALASENELHMTCDFKLTDAANKGRPLSVNAHKLVKVGPGGGQALVGVTGLAVLNKQPIGDWIAQRTAQLGFDATLEDLIAALRQASDELDRIPPANRRFRHLTFVVGAIQGSQSVIALLSNYQSHRGNFLPDGAIPGSDLKLDITRPRSPRLVVAGQVQAIRKEERKAVERLIRGGSTPEAVRWHMAALNERAASRTNSVSRGCYAASELATGRGETQAFLVEQVGDFIPPDLAEMFKSAGLALNPATLPDGSRAPIRMLGATSVIGPNSAHSFREQLKLRPLDSELWNNFGAFEIGRGNVESGRSKYERALQVDEHNYLAARNLAVVLWRVDGNRERGNQLFELALENPDANQRRETLSIVGDMLVSDGDPNGASRRYEEAMVEDPLTAVTMRWASFVLHYDFVRANEVELQLDDLLVRDSYCSSAIQSKALCLWWLHKDLPGARLLMEAHLARVPNDPSALSSATYLRVADGDLPGAAELMKQLGRRRDGDKQVVESLKGVLSICQGDPLIGAMRNFQEASGIENMVNLAFTQWALGDVEDSRATASGINAASLTMNGAAELEILYRLMDNTVAHSIEVQPNEFVDLRGRLLDVTMLRAFRFHEEVSDTGRRQLESVLGAVARR